MGCSSKSAGDSNFFFYINCLFAFGAVTDGPDWRLGISIVHKSAIVHAITNNTFEWVIARAQLGIWAACFSNALKILQFSTIMLSRNTPRGCDVESKNYLTALSKTKCTGPNGNVFDGIWRSYEGAVLHGLVTSFGLDFYVHNRQGGDVDSIPSVRSVGFESEEHRAAYEAREVYDTKAYHTHSRHLEIAQSVRKSFHETGAMQADAYVPGNTVAYSWTSAFGKEHRANLDHVISAHEIHADPGRILAGLDGK